MKVKGRGANLVLTDMHFHKGGRKASRKLKKNSLNNLRECLFYFFYPYFFFTKFYFRCEIKIITLFASSCICT